MPENKKIDEKSKFLKEFRALITKILLIALVLIIAFKFFIGVTFVHTNNMFPKIIDGDVCLTLKSSAYYSGDVIVYKEGDKTALARVIAVAGDEIDITDDSFTLNGITPYETIYYKTGPAPDSKVNYPYLVKDGEYFVLNDMREDSTDSRTTGAVSQDSIKGKVVLSLRLRGF